MSHHTAQEIGVINHWTITSLQREVKQFSPVSEVEACTGYFLFTVLNAEITTFVFYFSKILISQKVIQLVTCCLAFKGCPILVQFATCYCIFFQRCGWFSVHVNSNGHIKAGNEYFTQGYG